MKTWDEMEPRERDAWVHQYVFGNAFWTNKRGEYTFVVTNLHDGREPWCSSKYPKPDEYAPIDCADIDHMNHIVGELVKRFTTDASSDYEVLCRVRETWGPNQFVEFSVRLQSMLTQRLSGDRPLCGAMMFYRPGDYSHAAYLALTGGDR